MSANNHDIGAKLASLHSRIAKERKILEGFQAMRSATSNQDVIRTCESKIRETLKTIGWFEQTVQELELRQVQEQQQTSSSASSSSSLQYSSTTSKGLPPAPSSNNGPRPPPPGAAPSYVQPVTQYGAESIQPGRVSADGPLAGVGLNTTSNAHKVQYTNLDLIKADTPLTSAKISRMLHQLEFKLHVERQYKEGIDKMAKLYLVDGDKKARADTENKRVESKQKMVLLNQALKRYKSLDVMGELGDEDDGIPEDVKANLRRPLSGQLQITIKAARDLAHAPQPPKSKSKHYPSETVIYVKVEDTPRARTHPSRTDRWNEDFEIHVDKANEVEVTIYDKFPSSSSTSSSSAASSLHGYHHSNESSAPVPIGMLWLRLSDIVEELRRRKLGLEAGPGWVTAARVAQGSGGSGGSGSGHADVAHLARENEFGASNTASGGGGASNLGYANTVGGGGPGGSGPGQKGEGIDAWFAVEPEGAIMLHLNFVKSNVRKRPFDAQGGQLGRQGAVRKRKESIHEQNGHKFVVKQFYTVVLCALCGEFLLKGNGMQCEDCKYACHKNCYQKVVTKCISKSNTEADKDEEQINHRIPHRFEPITNISPNWCCHCGLVLPLGRKQARKCSECGVTAHTDCVHLVPDFCGMSMEMANKLLSDIKSINSHRRSGQQQQANRKPIVAAPPPSSTAPQLPPSKDPYGAVRPPVSTYDARPSTERLSNEVGRLHLVGNDQYSAPGVQPAPPQRVPVPPVSPNPYDGMQPPSPVPPVAASTAGINVAPPVQQQQPPPPSARDQQVVQPPPRQSSASTASSFGNDPRDSIGSLIGGYASDEQRRQSLGQQPQQQQRQQQQQPQQVPVPPQFSPYKQQQQQQQHYAAQYGQSQSAAPVSQQGYPQRIPPQAPAPQPGQLYTPPVSSNTPALSNRPSTPSSVPPQQSQPSPYAGYQTSQPQTVPRPLPPAQQAQQSVAPQQVVQQQQQQQQQVVPARAQQQQPRRRIGLDDFNFLAVLGKGNFGKVMLAEEKKSSQLYAIKVLKKEFIIENDEVESTKSEKRVFLAAARERHPFLLGLHSCFQTETRIYFVMEYVSGGDLMLHIQREQFTPRRAKFYAAEVLLALEYFHKMGIVYRDLKLDNILLTLDGHVKVADYGLCKEDMWFGKTTSTFCGTPEFMAPEIILEQRYGRAVDWWAFGVLIYEMLLGQSPFRGDDEDEIFDAILEDEPLYPIHMPKDSVSILQKLLTKDPARRLGASEADASEIKSHLFFKDTNWDDVFHKRIPSPFFPAISSATDTSNFDSEFTSEQPTLTPVHSTLSAQDQGEFAGFSWTANWAQ
ncbi:protein kinase C [Sporobolomyces koalae]|uniref:protein kinase C n=1 Tax=Sporobolomyces koalae TaxID=500713 RepID=UPI00317C98C8